MKKNTNVFSFIKEHPFAIAFVLILFLLPTFLNSDYFTRVLIEVFFFGALGTAWNILGGFGRQTSWASASFFAVGAYTSMLMFLKLGISPWISILAGMFISVLLASIIGLPCFKLRGVFFSIATIACAAIFRQCLYYFKDFTGGALGLAFKVRTKESFLNLSFLSELPYYYIALIWMLITVFVVIFINRSKLGYYLKAIREDEDAAESLGIRPHRMKMAAFAISAMLLSATGAIYAFKVGYIDPGVVASHDMSIRIGIVAILGGMGTIWGPILGAFICIPMLELSNYYLADFGGGGAGYAMYGLLIVLVVLFRPNGLISFFTEFAAKVKKKLKAGKEKKKGEIAK